MQLEKFTSLPELKRSGNDLETAYALYSEQRAVEHILVAERRTTLSNYDQNNNSENQDGQMVPAMESQSSYQQALPLLAVRLRGDLILPGDHNYESERGIWNGNADCHPALIVRCADVADVIEAVNFAREQGMVISVRSGGHSLAGYSTNDDGMVIDLSHMKSISIDPERRVARIEAGLTWKEVAEALQPYGLALTSGDTGSVGVGGLILGGGIGWMVRKYAMTIDHVRAVEVVTADGEFLRASADEHADLYWGLRGGGGNFGVATAFEVNVDPAGMILGGAVFYDAAEAESVLRAYTRYATEAPDELTTITMLMAAPPAPFIPPERQGSPVVAIIVCYAGDLAEGERVVEPLRHLGTPVADVIAPMPYPVMFAFTEEASIRGLDHYDRSMFMKEMSDDVLHIIAEAVPIISPATIVQIRILGGAMGRVPVDATAFAHRDKRAMVSVFNMGPRSADNERHEALADQVWQSLKSYGDGVYVNFLDKEGEQRVREAYPPATYERLAELKKRYDPDNLFHLNQNIAPARTGWLALR